ncbi:MAG: amidohydrolase family protein [Planctomycetota bacterium]
MPVEGGTAEQLTFGPYYGTDPMFSPDGARVAFVSDRDGSNGNVFVLELATGHITQVTHEAWAGRPTWTPDGQAIVYLRFVREAVQPWGRWERGYIIFPALIRRIALSGAEPETLSAPLRLFRSVFYMPDGRLAWTVIESKTGSPRWTTRIEVMSAKGTVSTLRTLEGLADRVVASATGEGFYCRCYVPLMFFSLTQKDDILFLPLSTGAERQILAVSGLWYSSPRFAVATDDKILYVGDSGRLWEVTLPGGARKPLAFSARVKLEIQDPVAPPKWAPAALGSSAPPRSVLWPRLSPDGRRLVFGAAGYLWQQQLDGGRAQRLFEGSAFEWLPASSPDGRQLAFVRYEHGKDREIKVFDFATRQTRTLASGSFEQLNWSPDGLRLVLARDGNRLVVMNVSDGRIEELFRAGDWEPHPHFSADGQSIYFTADGTLYRLQLEEKAKPEPITQLARPLADGRVSPDGKWLAFRRKIEIWVAPLSKEPVTEEDVRQLSPEADSFAFTPDGSGLVYSAGNRIWRHPLGDGERKEIPIRLELQRPTPPPLLLRRVRLLDFESGAFGPETSLFIEQGRIRWMGPERGRKLPREAVIVDAGSRFAIPGLFDMHVHTGFYPQPAMLAYGVTSVRNVGQDLPWLNALADRSEATSDPVARQFYSGDMFRSTHPDLGEDRALIESEHDARAYVRRWKERGVHFIKTHPPITWQLRRAVAQEARRLGLPVVGHGVGLTEVTQSATFGYASVEHASNRFYDDVLQMLALAGTRWDPTLTIDVGNQLLLRNEPERLADEKFRAFTPEKRSRARQAENPFKVLSDTALRGRWVELLATVRAAHRKGVRLLAGTDAPLDEAFSGVSLHWELESFVQAGLAPLEVLRIATQEGAAAVGAEDDLGTIEPGKLADLVLLDANPLDDIKNTQTNWRVIKGGWLYDPDKLRPPESVKKTE